MDQEEQKKENKVGDKVVRTYVEDMAGILEDNKEGLVKKMIEDEEANEAERQNLSPESKRNRMFMLAGFLFLALSFSVLLLLFSREEKAIPEVQIPLTPMIFNDKTNFVEVAKLAKDQIESTVWDTINNTEVGPGEVEGVYLTLNKKIMGLREFIKLLGANLVVGSTELVDDNFLLGVFNEGETRDLLIMFRIRSLSDIFDNMRAWENKMFYDLHGFLGLDLSANTNYLLTKNFEDGLIENKNARILYGEGGTIILMYIFVDDTHLLVTNDEDAIREVITRLAGSQIKK